MRSEPRYAFYLGAGVGFHIVSGAVTRILFTIPEVDAPGEFADDGEVDAGANGFFEGRSRDEGRGGEGAGAEVAECGEGFAEGEEALFGADGAGAPFLCKAEEGVRIVSARIGKVGENGWRRMERGLVVPDRQWLLV